MGAINILNLIKEAVSGKHRACRYVVYLKLIISHGEISGKEIRDSASILAVGDQMGTDKTWAHMIIDYELDEASHHLIQTLCFTEEESEASRS